MENVAKKILSLWKIYCERKKRNIFSTQVEKELSGLNPGMQSGKLVYEFYIKKIAFCLIIMGIGVGFIFLYVCSSFTDSVLEDGKYLERDVPGGMKKTVVLDAQVDGIILRDMEIPVLEKQFSEEEAEILLEELFHELPAYILGENVALSYVDRSLNLISSWDKAPVTIFWESSDREILAEDGSLDIKKISKEGNDITLTATLVCGDLVKERKIEVKVFPPVLTKDEELRQKLSGLLEITQSNSRTEEYLELPEQLEGKMVLWKERSLELLPVFIILLMVGVTSVFIGKDRELHQEYEKRNGQLLLEYPEFVSKLQLLLCSGMSVRSAFVRMAKEYQLKRKKGGKKQYVCEELLLAVRKMENGMPEIEALKFFGERCNLFCYKKLVSLICQNLKKGTDGLRESMMNESRNAFEERKQTARKQGEETGTKLLLPMMLMMGIVLVIIVLPAYFSFGGIN